MRVSLYILLLVSISWFAIFGCGSSTGTVTGQGTADTASVTLKATIFSSVPQGGGTKACSITCEYSYTAGADEILKAQGTLQIQDSRCDGNGIPETGQGIETKFTLVNDPITLEGGVIEVSCAQSGATLIDDITFNFFSASLDFNPNECFREGGCTIVLEATSWKEGLEASGLFEFLSNLKCPSLDFAKSIFCSDSTTSATKSTIILSATSQPADDSGFFCTTLDFVRSLANCGGGTPPACDCTTVKCQKGMVCDPKQDCKCVSSDGCSCETVKCNVGQVCDPKQGCQCVPEGGGERCSNGELDAPGDRCDTQFSPCRIGQCVLSSVMGICICEIECIKCLTQVCEPESSFPNGCDDHCDNDNDTLTDCDDPDCGCSSCSSGFSCLDTPCPGGYDCNFETHCCEPTAGCFGGSPNTNCDYEQGETPQNCPEDCDTLPCVDTFCHESICAVMCDGIIQCTSGGFRDFEDGFEICGPKPQTSGRIQCFGEEAGNFGMTCDGKYECTNVLGFDEGPFFCPSTELCNDSIDNDADLKTDCLDADCFGWPDCPPRPATCGNTVCDSGETNCNCRADCTEILMPPTCGSLSSCDAGEDSCNCYSDCHCGDAFCDSGFGENSSNCPVDCLASLPGPK